MSGDEVRLSLKLPERRSERSVPLSACCPPRWTDGFPPFSTAPCRTPWWEDRPSLISPRSRGRSRLDPGTKLRTVGHRFGSTSMRSCLMLQGDWFLLRNLRSRAEQLYLYRPGVGIHAGPLTAPQPRWRWKTRSASPAASRTIAGSSAEHLVIGQAKRPERPHSYPGGSQDPEAVAMVDRQEGLGSADSLRSMIRRGR